jgi:SPP1 family predicted phage head-tail adaptor
MRRTTYGSRKSTGTLAGCYDTLISLQRKTSGKDDLGQPIEVWTEYASVWADVLMLTGKETVSSGTQVGIASCSMRVRYRTDVTNGDRAVYGQLIFNIGQPLINLATREYVDLPCTQGANVG